MLASLLLASASSRTTAEPPTRALQPAGRHHLRPWITLPAEETTADLWRERVSEAPVLQLAYKHMSKCAGTFIREVVQNLTASQPGLLREDLLSEQLSLTAARRDGAFVIASVRNPCDYMASLWAYQTEKPWSLSQNRQFNGSLWQPEAAECVKYGPHADKMPPKCPPSANSDPGKWGHWVNETQRGSDVGIMTYRFWEQLVAGSDELTCYADKLLNCSRNAPARTVQRDMAAFAPVAVADCWVYTETLDADLERCLRRYEAASGATLDWAAFDAHAPTNAAPHASCAALVAAQPEVAARIMEMDGALARSFGYDTCCSAAVYRRDDHGDLGTTHHRFTLDTEPVQPPA